ncbi:unnamed protein product [Phytomonas sp. Hart1]|nr:unnamed protein product [Phytomonas sp. Hart1]|eukprot:CCW69429.1 unnamed protein product [Phytomonas sp. isolate Hart1]
MSVENLPLQLPLIRIHSCPADHLPWRILEHANCFSLRFLFTVCCCAWRPLNTVAKIGDAACGFLLAPLSLYKNNSVEGERGQHALLRVLNTLLRELLAPSARGLLAALPGRIRSPRKIHDQREKKDEKLEIKAREALFTSYSLSPEGSLRRIPAEALRVLIGLSTAAGSTLWKEATD